MRTENLNYKQPGQAQNARTEDLRPTSESWGQCLFTLLTPAGIPGGKVSARRYLPVFCDHLRKEGYRAHFCNSVQEVDEFLASGLPSVIVHLFGEDRFQITSQAVYQIEARAVATFNGAEIGTVLADKVVSQDRLQAAGIKMPQIDPDNGVGFQRQVLGSSEPSNVVDASVAKKDQPVAGTILTRFVDTRVRHRGATYFTTVRLMCIDDIVLHTFPRARDVGDRDPNVHTRNTPLDPSLIEALNDRLIVPHRDAYADIARRAYSVLGHGFYSHDLLVERTSGEIFLCESGFKFDDTLYTSHLAPIQHMLPSQAPLFPTESFALASARVFTARCNSMIEGST